MAIRDYYIAREAAVPDIELGGAPEVSHVVHEYPIESTPSTNELGTLLVWSFEGKTRIKV